MVGPEVPRDKKPKRTNRTPEIEISLGARVKALRMVSGMSQGALGSVLGITFQQVQKYETGKDRIAASTLQEIAAALKVHPGSFFNDGPLPVGRAAEVMAAFRDAACLQQINDPNVRKQLIALIRVLGNEATA